MIAKTGRFTTPRNVHLVGAGGIGVSALAQALLHEGHRVSGSDAREGDRVRKLRELGASVAVGHAARNLPRDVDVVVASAACPRQNPELAAARARGVDVIKYAEALGNLMEGQHGIAVAGCHGKTTTTGLLTTALVRGGLDPTMVLGGDAAPLGGNFRPGGGRYFVAEACEFDRSFLNLRPSTAVVTNIDLDHLDTYRDLDEIASAFQDFARLIPREGYLATLNEHEAVFRGDGIVCEVETFGLRGNGDWIATEWKRVDGVTHFAVTHRGTCEGVFELRLNGLHNVLNCLGVIAVARRLGLDFDDAVRPALREYRGVDRRMEPCYEGAGVLILDDYAHHPAEVAAVLSSLRDENAGRRVVAVLQPHRAGRCRRNLRAFAEALTLADRVFVSDIFCTRDSESDRNAVHALDLVRCAANHGVDVTYVESLGDAAQAVLDELRMGDLVVTMGAGNVGEVSRELAVRLEGFEHEPIAP